MPSKTIAVKSCNSCTISAGGNNKGKESRKSQNKQENSEDDSSKGSKAIAVFLLFLIAVAAGIIFIPKLFSHKQDSSSHYVYNYFDFYNVDGSWATQVQFGKNLNSVVLRHGPKELENLSVYGNIKEFRERMFDNNPERIIYITTNASVNSRYETMAVAEIAPRMVRHFGFMPKNGCIEKNKICDENNVSVVTCYTTSLPVIYVHVKNTTEPYVAVKGNCAEVAGSSEQLVMAADRLLWGLYGVMV